MRRLRGQGLQLKFVGVATDKAINEHTVSILWLGVLWVAHRKQDGHRLKLVCNLALPGLEPLDDVIRQDAAQQLQRCARVVLDVLRPAQLKVGANAREKLHPA